MEQQQGQLREEHAIILDYLEHGYAFEQSSMKTPIAQALGTDHLSLLELVPGLGKKHMWEILEARKDRPFEDLEDLKARVKLLPDPVQVVVKRVMLELEGKDKRRIFIG